MSNNSKQIIYIVTKSTGSYVPLNEPVKICFDRDGLPFGIHRISDGAGTYLFSEYDQKHTDYHQI